MISVYLLLDSSDYVRWAGYTFKVACTAIYSVFGLPVIKNSLCHDWHRLFFALEMQYRYCISPG